MERPNRDKLLDRSPLPASQSLPLTQELKLFPIPSIHYFSISLSILGGRE